MKCSNVLTLFHVHSSRSHRKKLLAQSRLSLWQNVLAYVMQDHFLARRAALAVLAFGVYDADSCAHSFCLLNASAVDICGRLGCRTLFEVRALAISSALTRLHIFVLMRASYHRPRCRSRCGSSLVIRGIIFTSHLHPRGGFCRACGE